MLRMVDVVVCSILDIICFQLERHAHVLAILALVEKLRIV